MNLSEPFIRRPVMTTLVMLSIVVFGILSYWVLPVSDLPDVNLPTIQVSVSYPGSSPDNMANSVATPLEQQFMTIQGIQTISSSSNTGSTTIVLQFDLDRDIDAASTDVQAAISRAQPNLPSDLPNNPTYEKVNPAATPILYYAIYSPYMTQGQLYDYANTFIGQRIAMVEGISQVITFGSPYAVRVQVDPEKLAAKNIGIDEVTSTLQQGNVELPLGNLYGQKENYVVDVDGQLYTAAPYSELVIKTEDGSIVKIKDVGRALDSVQNDKMFHSYITKESANPCIVLAIQKLPGANSVAAIKNIKQVMKNLSEQLPDSLKVFTIYDQSELIMESVRDVQLTLLVALGLVIAVIFFFLGKVFNTLVPALALPLSICGTFAFMYLFGFSVDILSLLAITLSVGFLVDDAIVVLENNVRHAQLGKNALDASIEGSKEISITIFSMTLSLAAALLPMLFMGGVIGRLFREFAATIISAVLFSGFISLSLTPLLSSRLIPNYDPSKKGRIERFSDAFNEKLKQIYKPCLLFAMKHRIFMLLMGAGCVAGSFFLYQAIPMDFLPPDDIGYIQGFTLSRDGTSPYLMDEYHQQVCQEALKDPSIESIISVSSYSVPNQGILFFRLVPFNQRPSMDEVIQRLTGKLNSIAGINTYLSYLPLINLQVGSTATALYQYSLTSITPESLYDYAPILTQKMAQNPLFSQVSSDLRNLQPQWSLHILRDRASNFHVNAAEIENFFSYAYSDNKISQINGTINQYNVIIETLPEFYKDPTVFSKLYVRSQTNALVPLSEILESKEVVGPLTVNHINGLPAVNISFNPGFNVPLGDSLEEIDRLVADKPHQIGANLIGTAQIYSESFESLSYLLLIAFFVIYVLLGILYESFVHPITVMSALPPTLFGGLLTLYLTGEALSLYSFVGLILLAGIVLKNGIMLVDFAIIATEKEGKSAYDAIIEASLIRFRPILMTTICAGMGAVPIALGIGGMTAQTTRPLGLCIVGGLLFSQLLTLLLTPVLYYYFEILQEKARAWIQSRKNTN